MKNLLLEFNTVLVNEDIKILIIITISHLKLFQQYSHKNKNDNIHKTKVQDIRYQTNIDKYRLASKVNEYNIILN